MWVRHKVAVTEADEAVADVDALWFDPDPHSRSGCLIRAIGYSHIRRVVLTVLLVPRENGTGYCGANGWEPNSSDRRRYERGE